uniref:Uncharacterized protein n=1 Tax=Timema bartmani TaxID=61472 RepID=A0A7R9EVK8_9NEOP|nr:unnamed protein product [Timema bartmani]
MTILGVTSRRSPAITRQMRLSVGGLGSDRLPKCFVVKRLIKPGILDVDFLMENHVLLDFCIRSISLASKELSLVKGLDQVEWTFNPDSQSIQVEESPIHEGRVLPTDKELEGFVREVVNLSTEQEIVVLNLIRRSGGELLEAGIISRCSSQSTNPLVCVIKKDRSVLANDSAGLQDMARVFIYLVREDQRVRFVLRQHPPEVRERIDVFRE